MVIVRERCRFRLWIVLVVLVGAAGCRDLAESGEASQPSGEPMRDQVVFVFDRSVSIQDHELEHALVLTRERIRRLGHGDRIVAIELLERALDEQPQRWATQVPEREFPDQIVPRDSISKARFLRDVEEYVVRFGEPKGREDIGGTDILSTMHLVAAELAAWPEHRTTFVLYSDMLQANEIMNMEGLTRMPAENWVNDQASRGTLPDLTGLCVVLVGVREDTNLAQVVKQFWEEYFEVTGAVLLDRNYTYRPVALPDHPCPGA